MPSACQGSQGTCRRNPRPLGARAAVQDRRSVASHGGSQGGKGVTYRAEADARRKVDVRLVPVIVANRPIQKSVECFGVLIKVHHPEQNAQDDDDIAHVANDAPWVWRKAPHRGRLFFRVQHCRAVPYPFVIDGSAYQSSRSFNVANLPPTG
jgi:hypothetical protein